MSDRRQHSESLAPNIMQMGDAINAAIMIVDSVDCIVWLNQQASVMLCVGPSTVGKGAVLGFISGNGSVLTASMLSKEAQPQAAAYRLILNGSIVPGIAGWPVPPLPCCTNGASSLLLLALTDAENLQKCTDPVDIRTAELLKLSNCLMVSHEKELKQASTALQNLVGQHLAALKIMTEEATHHVGRGEQRCAIAILKQTAAGLGEAINDLRRIFTDLRPSSLDHLGLLAALSEHCDAYRWAHEGIALHVHFGVREEDIPAYLKADIFRFVQDALRSVARHARATVVTLWMEANRTFLHLRITHNGEDLAAVRLQAMTESDGNAELQRMKARVEASGGTFLLNSRLNAGAAIEASWRIHNWNARMKEPACD